MALVTASLSNHKSRQILARESELGGRKSSPARWISHHSELKGYVSEYKGELEAAGWKHLEVRVGGLEVMFGGWPCEIL